MIDYDKALLDPASVFGTPDKVIAEGSLTREQKIDILLRWEYDARELEVATEENMGGAKPSCLDKVLKALNDLGYDPDYVPEPPTKHGGS